MFNHCSNTICRSRWCIYGFTLKLYVVNGIRSGFQIDFNYKQSCKSSMHNISSAREQAQVVRDYLSIECAAGRVLGPLNPTDIPGVDVSSFGVIPRKTPGK